MSSRSDSEDAIELMAERWWVMNARGKVCSSHSENWNRFQSNTQSVFGEVKSDMFRYTLMYFDMLVGSPEWSAESRKSWKTPDTHLFLILKKCCCY